MEAQLSAVIVDDLEDSRATLKQDLKDYCPRIQVVGEAEGVVTGLKLIKSARPDLVFLDINMNDGSGFDLLEILNEVNFKIIFTTASDVHAIRAFKFSAVDYLLKPIDIDELIAAVDKIDSHEAAGKDNYELLRNNLSSGKVHRIALHTLEKIHVCSTDDIIRCEANVNYTQFFFKDGSKKLITKTLKTFDQMLSESGFYRVHQSHLINSMHIKEYVKTDGGYLVMTDGASVPLSNRKRGEVLQFLSSM